MGSTVRGWRGKPQTMKRTTAEESSRLRGANAASTTNWARLRCGVCQSTASLSLVLALALALVASSTGKAENWSDDFESYANGAFPTNWTYSGNSAISVDASQHFAGAKSVKLYGETTLATFVPLLSIVVPIE